jgi:hypothetical protein
LIPSADGALAWPSPILPRWFGKTESEAKREYRNYVKKGIDQGRRPELVGGGLIRSQGGWSAVKALRRAGNRELGDDRILGSRDFVKQILEEAEGNVKYQLPVKRQDRKIDEFITQLCQSEKVSIKDLKSGSRRKKVPAIRSMISIGLVKNYGVSLAEVARRVGVSTTAIAKIMKRANQKVHYGKQCPLFYRLIHTTMSQVLNCVKISFRAYCIRQMINIDNVHFGYFPVR